MLVFSGCMIKSSLAVAVLSLCLSSCSVEREPSGSPTIEGRFNIDRIGWASLYLITDKDTGWQYLQEARGGMVKLEKPQSTNP